MKNLRAIKPLGKTPFRGGGFPGSTSSSKRHAQNLAVLRIAKIITGVSFAIGTYIAFRAFFDETTVKEYAKCPDCLGWDLPHPGYHGFKCPHAKVMAS